MALVLGILLITLNLAIAPALGVGSNNLILDVKGIIPAVFTPIDDYGYLNYNIIGQYAQHLKDSGISGVLVSGTTGEGPALSVWDKRQLLSSWMDAATPLGLAVISQVGGIPLPDAQELASFSEQLGVAAILTLPELYYKPTNAQELVYYMECISKSAPNTPLLYYHVPLRTGVNVNMVKFFKMATEKISNFMGIKTQPYDTALQLQDKLEKGQKIFVADSLYLASAAMVGFDSFILPDANLFPETITSILKNAKRGIRKKVITLARKLLKLNEAISAEGNALSALKYAMTVVTDIDVGPIKDPEIALTEEQEYDLQQRLKDEGIKIKPKPTNRPPIFYPPIYFDGAQDAADNEKTEEEE